MTTTMLVREVMTSPSPFVKQGSDLGEVVKTLLEHGVFGLPVINDQHNLVGFVSEQDCIHTVLVSSYHCEGSPIVDEVMSREVLSVEADMSIIDLAQKMGKNKPKSYPVTEDGQLIGLVTRSAILESLWENRASCDLPNSKT
ncbi:Inosine-5'-monophosphate dehydrogenase [Zhongshania aliphaticivorans]|uniref:Inosine-5'-monophosphate dehydrogenase n=1 Tax=Zhongshania aliphaticivorans TaxID=1470434 RepID=A0A5S9PKW6_9GAMM|nr:CBS domain-containing protein [Zhongshania aliphaticivorans]CAA0104696.1 Inosine-5'-monophosphate dehydrogenase [Zhongshania aliphaticivorans]CAA0104957.1 Inosine-5'-monophosphate dehydrogenase [Zhongshania aliphaticivorans]